LIVALKIINAVLALGVIITVIMQSGKVAGLGTISGGAQTLFGKKKGMDELLARWTTWMAIAWLVATLLLTVAGGRLA
jgi:preprotein translocase subunit SecG